MKKSTQEKLQEHFTKIRFTLGDCRAKTLAEIAKAAENHARNKKMYNADFLEAQHSELVARASGNIAKIKEKAKQRIDSEVAAAKLDLQSWITEPMPEQLAAILNTYRAYDMQPSVSELRMLKDLAAGSYLGEKLIAIISDQIGVQSDFVSIDQLNKMLTNVRSDARSAVDNYAGVADSRFKFIADELGIQTSEIDSNIMLRDFGARYGTEGNDDSLRRVEILVSDITNADSTALTQSKRGEIDALFADCETDGDRLSTCINIMESGGSIADLMNVYDSDLTKKALSAIADQRRQDAEQSIRMLTQAKEDAAKATQAATSADMAARQAAGDYSL